MDDILKLQKELMKQNKWLEMKLSEQRKLIEKASQAEHDYRVALASKMTTMRMEGTPVTIIPDLCRGDATVAKLKMERDIAKGVGDACKEAIRSIRAVMSGIQTLLSTQKEAMKLI